MYIYPAGKLKVKFLFRMEVLAPEKKTHEENEDLQQYPQKPASCKKMLRNCCLIKRIFAWKSLSSKGTFSIENFSVGEIVVLPRILNFWSVVLLNLTSVKLRVQKVSAVLSLLCKEIKNGTALIEVLYHNVIKIIVLQEYSFCST